MSAEYSELRRVLDAAIEQASEGKGKERHAYPDQAFEDQLIVTFGERIGSNHFQIGQAVKKAIESARLEPAHAKQELLGAINYLAAAVLLIEGAVPEGIDVPESGLEPEDEEEPDVGDWTYYSETAGGIVYVIEGSEDAGHKLSIDGKEIMGALGPNSFELCAQHMQQQKMILENSH